MVEPKTVRESAWHCHEPETVLEILETDPARGLSAEEAAARLERFGPNAIPLGEQKPWWRILLDQFTDPLILVLLVAAVISVIFVEYVDAAVILAVVLINGSIGFTQEIRARKAIGALSEMTAPRALVLRDGRKVDLPAEELVPGDLVLLTSGVRVPADLRLVQTRELWADESALTGESQPAAKQVAAVEDRRAVAGDQPCMAFSGTTITRGRGRGVVVRTGHDSMLGRIAETTHGIAIVVTPIQRKMATLGKAIGAAVVLLSGLVVAGGIAAGMAPGEVVRTAVALAVGAVPEALPIVMTVTLAVGVQRMSTRNAIVRSLPAVETLGSTTVIASDKTGTLTANQMTVRAIWTAGERHDVSGAGYGTEGEIRPGVEASEALRLTLLAGVLANEAEGLPRENGELAGGDPTELALLVAASKAGLDPPGLREGHPALDLIPFESERRLMASLNEVPQGRRVFVKGSPEAVIRRCRQALGPDGRPVPLDPDEARAAASDLAEEGFRVLAMALKDADEDAFEGDDPGGDLILAGLQAMEDPLRPESRDAIEATRRAGIRVLMLTGDHPQTARAIGRQLGLREGVREGRDLGDLSDAELDRLLGEVDIFARVAPEHKLRLVDRLAAQGHIVAVTGDGVNDAPALQAAHLGVAMGRSGTDVARQAADMVLVDDNFASITAAVEEGRVVFSNIRKVTYFLLSTGVGLVLTVLSSLFGPWPLPYMAAQVLWINLVTKGLQDVSLAFEPGEPDLLQEPPRDPGEQVLNRPVLWRMFWLGLYMALGTLAVFWWVLQQPGASLELARSAAMTQMVMFQFFHVFNCRSFHRSLFQVPLLGNPYVLGSVSLALLAHLAVLHLPFLQGIFETEPLPLTLWAVMVPLAFTIVLVAELDKRLVGRRPRPGPKDAWAPTPPLRPAER